LKGVEIEEELPLYTEPLSEPPIRSTQNIRNDFFKKKFGATKRQKKSVRIQKLCFLSLALLWQSISLLSHYCVRQNRAHTSICM
jgi:hypothetical protein